MATGPAESPGTLFVLPVGLEQPEEEEREHHLSCRLSGGWLRVLLFVFLFC